MDDAACPTCGGRFPAVKMKDHLKQFHPIGSWGEWGTGSAFDAHGRVIIGVKRRIDYALAVWPDDMAPRSIVRAMLPEKGRMKDTAARHQKRLVSGSGSAGDNRTTKQFQEALRQLEIDGLIARGTEYIKILNRGALWNEAMSEVRGDRVEFLAIERAVEPARQRLREAQTAQRRAIALRDLQAVYDLMKHDVGIWSDSRRAVRHVPHGWRGRPS